MMKLSYNFHSHTRRCGHAYGTDEEYVKEAIDRGIEVMGFSDHAFLPSINEPGMRGSFSLLNEYIESVHRLKDKYKEQIDIKLAFEIEYSKTFLNYYDELCKRYGFDYLILGQHSRYIDGFMYFYSGDYDSIEAFKEYTNDLIEGMRSGYFLYVCHPDLFRLYHSRHDHLFKELSLKIIQAAKELDIPLELNMGRSRVETYNILNGRDAAYPDPEFWKLVKEVGAKVTIGVDSHSPKDVFTSPFDYFEKLIKGIGLEILSKEEMLNRIDKLKKLHQ